MHFDYFDKTKADSNVNLPMRSTKGSAGYDIVSPLSFVLRPGQEITINTNLKVYMDEDFFLMVLPRSGSGFKHYVRLANTAGVIDSDYPGEIKIKLRNESSFLCKILSMLGVKRYNWNVRKGQGIAQAIFIKYGKVDNDHQNRDRLGGFGSTDQ